MHSASLADIADSACEMLSMPPRIAITRSGNRAAISCALSTTTTVVFNNRSMQNSVPILYNPNQRHELERPGETCNAAHTWRRWSWWQCLLGSSWSFFLPCRWYVRSIGRRPTSSAPPHCLHTPDSCDERTLSSTPDHSLTTRCSAQGSYRKLCVVFPSFPRKKITHFPNFSRWLLPPYTLNQSKPICKRTDQSKQKTRIGGARGDCYWEWSAYAV